MNSFSPLVKSVKVVRYLEAAGPGGSRSQVLADEKGGRYVVKFKENGQGLRVLANELVANKLAQFIRAPVPEGVIIGLDEQLLSINPSLNQIMGRPISAGKHFGTVEVRGVYKLPAALVKDATNRADLAGIIVLNILTLNSDWKFDHCLLIRPDFAPGQLCLSAIDFGHCFGTPNWDTSIAQRAGQGSVAVFPEMVECIQGRSPFEPYLSSVKSLTEDVIAAIIAEIPEEWNVSQDEREALKSFLIKQKDQLEPIILSNKDRFPLWL